MTFGYPMSDMVFRSHIEGSQVAGVSLHVKCQPLVIDNNVFSFEIWIFKICKSSWWELSHMACNTSDVELMMPAGPRSSSVIRLDKVTFHLKWLVTRAINSGLGKKSFFFKLYICTCTCRFVVWRHNWATFWVIQYVAKLQDEDCLIVWCVRSRWICAICREIFVGPATQN